MSILRQHLSSTNFTLAWTEHYMNLRSPKRMKHFSETLVATESGITKHMHRFDSKTATSQNQSWDKSIRWHRRQQARLSGLLFHYVRKTFLHTEYRELYEINTHVYHLYCIFSFITVILSLYHTPKIRHTYRSQKHTHRASHQWK